MASNLVRDALLSVSIICGVASNGCQHGSGERDIDTILAGLQKGDRQSQESVEGKLIALGGDALPQLTSKLASVNTVEVRLALTSAMLCLQGLTQTGVAISRLKSAGSAGEIEVYGLLTERWARPTDEPCLRAELNATTRPEVKKWIERAYVNVSITREGAPARDVTVEVTGPRQVSGAADLEWLRAEYPRAPDATVRSAVCAALAARGDRADVELFREIVSGGSTDEERVLAANFFRRVGTEADMQLLAAVETKSIGTVARAVAEARQAIEARTGAKGR